MHQGARGVQTASAMKRNDPHAAVASGLARSLSRATGEGYRLGFGIARDEAAFLALQAGRADIADAIRALRPRPLKREQAS
jgi:hypothetical protein